MNGAKRMNVEIVKIGSLKPYPRNARVHSERQIEMIAESIKEFGFLSPVIIDENNMILAGHGRVEGAMLAGLSEVPCYRICGLTDDQKRAYILVDNKLSDLSEWDFKMLQGELDSIDINMEDYGMFDVEEFDDSLVDTFFKDGVHVSAKKRSHSNKTICPRCGFEIET